MMNVSAASDKSAEEMSDYEVFTAIKSENPTSVLKGVSDIGQSMRLMETIEDGSKAQIVLEDISPRDADAIHAFQLAGGKGRLVISEHGITYEG